MLNGSRANKAAVVAEKGPAVLHLATHGFFLDDTIPTDERADPVQALARSGLALANANLTIRTGKQGGTGDGLLTALEVLSMDLGGTQLVVLSACDSGLGQISTGEGVYGLERAFQEAGARHVLATLWPIADEATNLFMQSFYRRVARGEPSARALRSTQLEFIHRKEWQAPLFWAPFMLTGK